MFFQPDEIYHIYNRGNNKQTVFFNENNYLYFLKKVGKEMKPFCDILCWTLMPNHFHLIIHTNEQSCKKINSFGNVTFQALNFRVGKLLSSYSQAINKQNKTTGTLFQPKSKYKNLCFDEFGNETKNYLINCMHYVHQNAKNAGLVTKIEDWPYSSFLDYSGLRNGTLCNKDLLMNLTGYDVNTFYKDSYDAIPYNIKKLLF